MGLVIGGRLRGSAGPEKVVITKVAVPRTRRYQEFAEIMVLGHDLTEEKKGVFAGETAVVLTPLLPLKSKMRIARLFGVKPDVSPQIAFQFGELSPAISEPFVVHFSSQSA